MNRTDEIKDRLVEHFGTIGIVTATPTRDGWECFPVTAHHQYGWVTPIPFGTPPLLVAFCPEVIAEQTEWLDDEQLDTYLTVLEYTLDRHITRFGDTGVEQVQREIEDEVLQHWPTSLHLMNQVQLRALDAKV